MYFLADITKKVPIYVHFVEKLQTFDLRALGGSFCRKFGWGAVYTFLWPGFGGREMEMSDLGETRPGAVTTNGGRRAGDHKSEQLREPGGAGWVVWVVLQDGSRSSKVVEEGL